MRPDETWSMEGAFARNYTMFGLSIVVYLSGLIIMKQWRTSFLLVGFIVGFFVIEFFVNKTIEGISQKPKYEMNGKRQIVSGCIMIGGGIFLINNIWSWIPEEVYDEKGIDFGSTYLRSLIVSVYIFEVFVSMKLILIGSGIINGFEIKRGYLGVIYRGIVILQNVVVMRFWVDYFEGKGRGESEILKVINGECGRSTRAYISGKFLLLGYLFWDVTGVWREVKRSKTKFIVRGMVGERCELCQKSTGEVVHLRCGHGFCEGCINKTVLMKPFCPICEEPSLDMPNFSYGDGYPSLASLLCCF